MRRTIRNLGTVYALMGDLVKAEAVLRQGADGRARATPTWSRR